MTDFGVGNRSVNSNSIDVDNVDSDLILKEENRCTTVIFNYKLESCVSEVLLTPKQLLTGELREGYMGVGGH